MRTVEELVQWMVFILVFIKHIKSKFLISVNFNFIIENLTKDL